MKCWKRVRLIALLGLDDSDWWLFCQTTLWKIIYFEHYIICMLTSYSLLCRWRKLNTPVKSVMGNQRLLCINSTNCPGNHTWITEGEIQIHHVKLHNSLSDAYGSFLPSGCSSFTWNVTALTHSCLWTASWASRWWYHDTWPCCPTAQNQHGSLLVSAGVRKPPCKTPGTLLKCMRKKNIVSQ